MKGFVLGSLLFVTGFAVFSTSAQASAVDNFALVSTYTAGTASTAFSAAGAPITMNFAVPNNISAGFTDSGVAISIGFGGATTIIDGAVTFFALPVGGLFDIDIISGGNAYEWQFFGPQSYDTSGNLLLGAFSINPAGQSLSKFLQNGMPEGFLAGGSVTVTSSSTTTGTGTTTPGTAPEPSSLLLFGTGLLGLSMVIRRRLAHG